MSRRRSVLSVIALAALLLGPGSSRPAAAADSPAIADDSIVSVNGESVSADELEDLLEEWGVTGPTIPGVETRNLLTELIRTEALRQMVERRGLDPGERADAGSAQDPGFLRDQARYEALLADLDDVRAEYEENAGVAAGQICLQFIGFADGDAAEEAMSEIDEGGDFDEVGAAADESYAERGGFLGQSAAQPCLPSDGPIAEEDALLDAVAEVPVGDAAGPIEITEDFFVIARAAPFDSVASAFAAGTADAEVAEFLADADVTVDPRYGRWDAETQSVVPLGEP